MLIVTTLPAQSPKFVPGEVIIRFVPGSEASAAVQRAAAQQAIHLSGLVPIVNDLGARVGVPLRPARITSGDFCVLSVDSGQLGELLMRQLGARRNVARVQVVRDTSAAGGAGGRPSPIKLILEFSPSSAEFKTVARNDGRLARLVASLERDVGLPLTGKVVEQGRLALQVNLEALTLRLVERLKAEPIVESVQPNYILEGFMR